MLVVSHRLFNDAVTTAEVVKLRMRLRGDRD
jgi:hypothetical protein